ncbi:MAG: S26 family signal peptidase [Gemmatales bacterium]|nr:S26 family signal peptidase [Gemmatales bacterium]MDW8387341.1 S26 family signal peptidase [Gemmatales bacterium]
MTESAAEKPSYPSSGSSPASAEPSFVQRVKAELFRPRSRRPKEDGKDTPRGDSLRESVETVVFVIVLVLMLKAFVAEAFVIPTGSMATSLLGYHRHAHCQQCGHEFPVNASDDAEGSRRGQGQLASLAVCPNCRNIQPLQPGIDGGDKVLVLKPHYDLHSPQRLDVFVFKYPGKQESDGRRIGGPQENFTAKNYIKRLWGLPGEKLSIWHGDVYLIEGGKDGQPLRREIIRKPPVKMLEMRRSVSDADQVAADLKDFLPPLWADEQPGQGWQTTDASGTFQVQAGAEERRLRYRHFLRPPPLPAQTIQRVASSIRMIGNAVSDAQRERLVGTDALANLVRSLEAELPALDEVTLLPTASRNAQFREILTRLEKRFTDVEEGLAVLRRADGRPVEDAEFGPNFKERIRLEVQSGKQALSELRDTWEAALQCANRPQLITDFLGYNALVSAYRQSNFFYPREWAGEHEPHWVRDLMVECTVEVLQPGGTFGLEIQAGCDLHRATFDLSSGECVLRVLRFNNGPEPKEIAVQKAVTRLGKPGKYRLRFSNFDERLTLWVDGSLPFGDGLAFPSPSAEDRAPRVGDTKPVALVAKEAAVRVSQLRLFRDIYYTRSAGRLPTEYEDLRLLDLSALGVTSFLSLSAQETQLPAHAKIERWEPIGRQRPWYYPMGMRQEFGHGFPDPELSNGPVFGPDEFFALGDNSTRSSDSREWGQVPRRLFLGKAVIVYWPYTRFGIIW